MASGAQSGTASWIAERRISAATRASELAPPTRKDKRWEFTDISDLDLDGFTPAGEGDASALERAESYLPGVDGAMRVDQVDGSALTEVPSDPGPEGPLVLSLDDAAEQYPDLVEPHLGSIVPAADRISADNEAKWTGGAFVYVPAGTHVAEPIQLTVVHDTPGSALHWRTLIVVEESAEAEVWERWLSGSEDCDGLLNATTEIVVGQNANLRFVCGQELSEKTWVMGTQRGEIQRDATLDWVALGFGGGRGKVRMETKLAGRGSNAKVTGAYAVRGTQHLDFDTNQEHAAEDTTSDLAFRGILDDAATAVWWGMIVVDPGAQRTDAFQESRNLILSSDAHADAIPGLEIQADDVACTHAAAIAQVDKEQLFYLQSRGLNTESAKRLVIEGFLAEMVERLPEGPVHDAVAAALEQRLDEVLGERPEQLEVVA
ncbi:MAG: Fe-S cluster assembly protein SufD [Solirubrobacterales bacterium]